MSRKIELGYYIVSKLNATHKPTRATKHSACYDLYMPYDVTVSAHGIACMDLDIAFDIPDGYCLKIYGRSSTFMNRGLAVISSVIDSDYKSTIHGLVYNMTDLPVQLKLHQRIFQCKLERVYKTKLVQLTTKPSNSRGCLGSTGD